MGKTERRLEKFVAVGSVVAVLAGAFATAYNKDLDPIIYAGGAVAAANLTFMAGRDTVKYIGKQRKNISRKAFEVIRELEGDYVEGER